MKKVIALLLCLAMMFSLCACSAQGISQNGNSLFKLLLSIFQSFDVDKAVVSSGYDIVLKNNNSQVVDFDLPVTVHLSNQTDLFF